MTHQRNSSHKHIKNNLYSRLPRGISYNHLIFTIPFELRDFFNRHRKALTLLPKTASDSICFFLGKQQQCIPGIIAVIHTFGAKLHRNPHVHLLITHGAYSLNDHHFIKDRYIPNKGVRKSRTVTLVKNFKERCIKNLSGDKLTTEITFLNNFYDYHNQTTGKKMTGYV